MPPPAKKRMVQTANLNRLGPLLTHKQREAKISSDEISKSTKGGLRKVTKATDLGHSVLGKRKQPAPKKIAHPLAEAFNGTCLTLHLQQYTRRLADTHLASTAAYRQDVSSSAQSKLEPVYQDLVVRAKGRTTDSEGNPVPDPLKQSLVNSVETIKDLFLPLAEAKLTLTQIDKTTGEKMIVSLGETMTEFRVKVHQKRKLLEGYWREWEAVQQEIAELGAEILGEEMFPTQFGFAPVTGRSKEWASNAVEIEGFIERQKREIEAGMQTSLKAVEEEEKLTTKERKDQRAKFRLWLQEELED